jgi:hypothetical protein
MPLRDTASRPEIALTEEEISDVSLATFYVFDRESAGTQRLQVAGRCTAEAAAAAAAAAAGVVADAAAAAVALDIHVVMAGLCGVMPRR